MFQYDGLVVGQRIRNLRVEAGYELGEFSDELGKSESHIKQVELGSRKISLDPYEAERRNCRATGND